MMDSAITSRVKCPVCKSSFPTETEVINHMHLKHIPPAQVMMAPRPHSSHFDPTNATPNQQTSSISSVSLETLPSKSMINFDFVSDCQDWDKMSTIGTDSIKIARFFLPKEVENKTNEMIKNSSFGLCFADSSAGAFLKQKQHDDALDLMSLQQMEQVLQ